MPADQEKKESLQGLKYLDDKQHYLERELKIISNIRKHILQKLENEDFKSWGEK